MVEETKKEPDVQMQPQPQGSSQPASTNVSQGGPAQPAESPGVQKGKHLFAKITCCLGLIFLIFAGAAIFYIQMAVRDEQKTSQKSDRKNQKAIYNIPDTSKFIKKKNYDVAAVFIHIDEETPDEVIEAVCNTDQTNINSYYHTGYWFKAQATNYSVDFNMNFKCLKKKIKPPPYFEPDPNSYITCRDGTKVKSFFSHFLEFDAWMRKNYPELSGYEYIAMTVYDSTNTYRCSSHGPAYANIYQNTAMMELKKQFSAEEAKALMNQDGSQGFYDPDLYSGRLPAFFAHEFAHLIGAKDKYETNEKGVGTGQCMVDKTSGIRYEDDDVMCHGTRVLKEIKITTPTAKEIGWVN